MNMIIQFLSNITSKNSSKIMDDKKTVVTFKVTIYSMTFLLCTMLSLTSCSNNKKKLVNSEFEFEKYIFEEIQKLENENEKQIIANQKFFIGNDSLKLFDLKDLLSKKRIIFWFSQNTCSPCIDRSVDIIKNVFPNYENNKQIIFISPDYPIRFRGNCYSKELLTLQNKYFGIELEKKDVPFFLILNSQLQVESIHIVNKSLFSRTEEYLQEIKEFIQ